MIHRHIDIGSVLRGAVCELYSNLVTRPTGAAVRSEIERAVAEAGAPTVTVIDFSQVTLLDFSCADEIVAKLMLRHVVDAADAIAETRDVAGASGGYFVFRGICERHLDAIEAVLERHGLAIVALADSSPDGPGADGEPASRPQLVGEVGAEERRLWERLCTLGPADARALAADAGVSVADAASCLERLARRRLAIPVEGGYLAVGLRVPPAPPGPAVWPSREPVS